MVHSLASAVYIVRVLIALKWMPWLMRNQGVEFPAVDRRMAWTWFVLAAFLACSVYYLHLQGRPWWCACGQPYPWSGEVNSRHNSQHLADPYSFTHVLHGVIFYGLLAWGFPRTSWTVRFQLATVIETLWEMLENSEFIIDRYRTTNIALGYEGDSIVNTLGDILCSGAGFALARVLGWKGSLILCAVTELVLLIWIRDSLFLSGLMLLYPFEAINAWQAGQ
jgi:hypothetical protein